MPWTRGRSESQTAWYMLLPPWSSRTASYKSQATAGERSSVQRLVGWWDRQAWSNWQERPSGPGGAASQRRRAQRAGQSPSPSPRSGGYYSTALETCGDRRRPGPRGCSEEVETRSASWTAKGLPPGVSWQPSRKWMQTAPQKQCRGRQEREHLPRSWRWIF